MSLLNGSAARAREMIDFHMANESPEFRAKVFEILNFSGLEPNDPMFLALLLTGQMRVFLEAAPKELHWLLEEWKQETAKSFSKLMSAMTQISEAQQEQAEIFRENMEAVSIKCVSDIKEAGMSTVGAISQANNETLEQIQQTKKQNEDFKFKFTELDAKFDAREQKSIEKMNALIAWVNKTTQKQEAVNQQIALSVSGIDQIQRNKIWLKIADGFWSLPALVASGLILVGGTWWIAYKQFNSPNAVFGRNLVELNIDRINHCFETNNPKCTFIMPP
ncbi:MAG: DUF6753 family protein [Waterburya sp.]